MATITWDCVKYGRFYQKHARDLLVERARKMEKSNVWYNVDINPIITLKDDNDYPWFVHVTRDGRYIVGHLFGDGGAYETDWKSDDEALVKFETVINSRIESSFKEVKMSLLQETEMNGKKINKIVSKAIETAICYDSEETIIIENTVFKIKIIENDLKYKNRALLSISYDENNVKSLNPKTLAKIILFGLSENNVYVSELNNTVAYRTTSVFFETINDIRFIVEEE